MREAISLTTMFLLLALAGIEPSHAEVSKTCKPGALAAFFSTGC